MIKLNREYIPIIIFFLFIFGMLINCVQLVQGTGDFIYLLLLLIPTPVFVLIILVIIFKIRE